MTSLIQKEAIKIILSEYYDSLESILFRLKCIYEKNTKISDIQRFTIKDRMYYYFDGLKKTKTIIHNIYNILDQEDRIEITRLCKIVIELNLFIKDDAKELAYYLKTGQFESHIKEELQ